MTEEIISSDEKYVTCFFKVNPAEKIHILSQCLQASQQYGFLNSQATFG